MKNPEEKKVRVAIIGSQGVPPQYGGFETLVDNIISNRSERVEYTIFCSRPDMDRSLSPNKLSYYKGCRLRYLPLPAHGIMSVPYDVLSMIKASRGYDAILILGVSGCIFLPFLRIFSRVRTIVNIDGLEHLRDKWRPLAKKYLRFSLGVCMRWANEIISDNRGIQKYVDDTFRRHAHLIAYGGDHALRHLSPARQESMLSYLGIESKKYDLSICRIEPENNCHITLEAYASRDETIVFVGNWNHSDYSKELYKKYKGLRNIRMLDAIYDPDILFTLRNNARIYVHGHRSGGTNPSLVEAMFFNLPILAFDVIYNRETTHNKAYYYTDVESLRALLTTSHLNGDETTRIAQEEYRWKKISSEYENLLLSK